MRVNLAAAHLQGEKKKQAEKNRKDVTQRMTPAQITEAKWLSEQCRSKKLLRFDLIGPYLLRVHPPCSPLKAMFYCMRPILERCFDLISKTRK
jgi:hypothetical protein